MSPMSESTIVAEANVAVDIDEATPEEGRQILDRAARRLLNMSGDEFLLRWHRGEFSNESEQRDVSGVALLIPFVE